MSSQHTEARIEAVTGEPLSGVSFVHDYVELHFDGKIVRSLTMPTVNLASAQHKFPETGSRDALCSLIGLTVERVTVKEDVYIEIAFSGEARVRIPLAPEERSGPEAAHYVPGLDQPIAVW